MLVLLFLTLHNNFYTIFEPGIDILSSDGDLMSVAMLPEESLVPTIYGKIYKKKLINKSKLF